MVDPVAAPAVPRLTQPSARRAARLAARTAAVAALVVGLYLVAGWIGSAIPRNPGWREPTAGVTILVESNATHTGLVLPITTPQKDWRATFPAIDLLRGGQATHVAIGWGEREVFLDVPNWSDLSPVTALRILAAGGESVMRVSPYIRPIPDAGHRPLRLTPAQYARLVARIEASLPPAGPGGTRHVLAGTDPMSLYYPALGRYTMLATCNTWTGDVLGDAGVRTGWWTPLAGGVTKWVPRPTSRRP